MLVVENNKYYTNWSLGNAVHPLEYSGDIVVAVDPSKSNMCLFIGTPQKKVLNILEFSGNNRKRGPVMDTSLYCEEVKVFLKEYLKNANIFCAGIEQAIMKEGMKHYKSQMTLTEIRATLINFFLDTYGIQPVEVNNWAWKSHVLPKGYRSQFEKGSKKFFLEQMPESPLCSYFEADATDCFCIYLYLCDTKCGSYSCVCNKAEPPMCEYMYFYTAADNDIPNIVQYKYNSLFSLEENIAYYINRSMEQFYLLIPIKDIDWKDVYGKTVAFDISCANDEYCKVVARRK